MANTQAEGKFIKSLSGDASGSGDAIVVDKIKGTPVSATTPTSGQALVFNGSSWEPLEATAANTASAIVKRDSSGNFAAGAISGKQFTDTIVALGSLSGTLTVDWATSAVKTVTLNGNVTTFTNSNMVAGQTATLLITQDATGSRTIAGSGWTSIKWPAGTPPTLTATASKTDIISIFYDGTSFWGFVGGQGY